MRDTLPQSSDTDSMFEDATAWLASYTCSFSVKDGPPSAWSATACLAKVCACDASSCFGPNGACPDGSVAAAGTRCTDGSYNTGGDQCDGSGLCVGALWCVTSFFQDGLCRPGPWNCELHDTAAVGYPPRPWPSLILTSIAAGR